jgi:hypothetical protein
MAKLSNINGRFAVEDDGAIQFNGQAGTSGYVLESRGASSPPVWTDRDTGKVTGSGAANRVTYWDSATNVTSDAGFTYNGTGRVSTDESFNVIKDGADTVADGPFFALKNAAGTRQYINQLDASNNIDYWYYNGSTWAQTISLLNDGGATFAGKLGVGLAPVEQLTVSGAIMSTGGITGHGANRTTISQEGANGAFWQSYGANSSTYGTFTLRQASSDFSLTRTPLSINSSGNSTFAGIITTTVADNDTVYADGSGVGTVFLYTKGTYTGFRQGTDKSFNIDTYNSNSYLNALKIRQDGTTDLAGLTTIKRTGITGVAKADMTLQIGYEGNNGQNNLIGFGYNAQTNIPAYIGYTTTSGGGSTKGDLVFGTRSVTTNTAPSERMRIQSDGNVLIGTTGVTNTRLKVVQNAASEWACQITSTATSAYGLAVDTSANTGVFSLGVYTNTGTGMFVRNEGKVGIGTVSPTSKLDISDAVDRVMNSSGEGQFEITGNGYTFGIAMGDTTTALYHNSGARSLTLGTDETPRLTILGGGNVGINTTNPGTKLHVSSNGTSARFESSGSYSDIQFVSTAGMNFVNFGSANQFLLYQNGGSASNVTTKIDTSGNATFKGDVVAYGSPSDIRLKENIKPIESALDKVSKLNGVTFDWKEKTEHLDKEGNPINLQQWKHDIGFIAQDVQKVIPELVRENDNGMLSMRHQGIAPILLEAIKELKAEMEELKSNKCNCNK